MPQLLLVRHSQTAVQADLPAAQWHLTETGRQRCLPLAQSLAPYQPQRIVTSSEVKAIETGSLLSQYLKLPMLQRPGLHEHERSHTAWFEHEADFQAALRAFFEQPDELVFGEESAHQARVRFTEAVEACCNEFDDQSFAIVAHGTVMSLILSQRSDHSAYELWSSLRMPAYAVLSLPDLSLQELVTELGA